MQIIKTEKFDDSIDWRSFGDMLFDKDIKLKDNECFVLHCTDGRTIVMSQMNKSGGICDDCKGDLPDKIASYDIVSF